VNYLKYDFDSLLFRRFKKKYLLNKVLNNNGYLSYHLLKEGSISLANRQDVRNFKTFILSHIASGRLLDVGCGTLEVPGYLDFKDKRKFEFFGIDPIEDDSFLCTRIVGCAEFMPFANEEFDAAIFATSLDHVCSVDDSIREVYRVLRKGGKVLVWMSEFPTMRRLMERLRRILENLRTGHRIERFIRDHKQMVFFDRFVVYPNYLVLPIPKGAIDPFHAYVERPQKIIRLMKKAKFVHLETVCENRLEVFLCFTKTVDHAN
jgi:ubiquinone/menaquinone biosynthesis C-methylase UbiE